jgi:hypothetical protein
VRLAQLNAGPLSSAIPALSSLSSDDPMPHFGIRNVTVHVLPSI